MVSYGLAKVLRGVKAPHTRNKSANDLETYSCKDLQAILKKFKVNLAYKFFKFIRNLRSTIK